MIMRHIGIVATCVLICLTGLIFSASSSTESPDDILVFVNRNTSVNDVSVTDIKQVFLKKRNNWPSGGRIVCINAAESTPLREAFRSKVLNMTAHEEATYWENQRIRRQLFAPPEIANGPKAVFKLKDAIGYAYRKNVPENVVKVILVIPQ